GSDVPVQFVYEAADCRIFFTPQTIYNYTNLWSYAADATWQNPALCVSGSTGYATTRANPYNATKPPSSSAASSSSAAYNASTIQALAGNIDVSGGIPDSPQPLEQRKGIPKTKIELMKYSSEVEPPNQFKPAKGTSNSEYNGPCGTGNDPRCGGTNTKALNAGDFLRSKNTAPDRRRRLRER
ncbi:hypothetical protein MMC25_000245, partial [Agyrium rufum]|nr:hypothetical protein [Agyrium rufum]